MLTIEVGTIIERKSLYVTDRIVIIGYYENCILYTDNIDKFRKGNKYLYSLDYDKFTSYKVVGKIDLSIILAKYKMINMSFFICNEDCYVDINCIDMNLNVTLYNYMELDYTKYYIELMRNTKYIVTHANIKDNFIDYVINPFEPLVQKLNKQIWYMESF